MASTRSESATDQRTRLSGASTRRLSSPTCMHVFHRYHNQCAVGHLLFEAFRGRPSVGTTRNQRIVHVFGCPQLGHIGRDVDACYSTDGAWQLTLRESRADEFPSDGNGETEALPIEEAGSAAYPERCTLMHTYRSGNPYGRTDV